MFIARSVRLCGIMFAMVSCMSAAQAACRITNTDVYFATYNPSSPNPNNSTGRISVSCSRNSGSGPYSLALSTGGGGTYAGRRMTNGNSTIPYQLYTSSAYSQVWGDGHSGTQTVAGIDHVPHDGGTSTYTVFARIAPRLLVNPGTYIDVIIVTANF